MYTPISHQRQHRYLYRGVKATLITSMLIMLSYCTEHTPPSDSFEVARKGVYGGAMSADARFSIVGSIFDGGSLWRNTDAERIYNWNHDKGGEKILLFASIEPDNQWALTADDATLVIWDMDTGAAARFWTAPGEILATTLGTGGRYALLGLADHSAVMFDAMRGGIVRTFTHEGRVRSVDMSADRRLAITGSEDKTAKVWRVESGELLITGYYQEDVQLVKISPDGRYAIMAAQFDQVELWDIQQRKSLGMIPISKEKLKRGLRVSSARFSNDNRYLLLGYPQRKVELWKTQPLERVKAWTLPKRQQWQPTNAAAIDVAFETNKRFWTMSSDGFIHLLQ